MTTSDDDEEFGMKKTLYKLLIICFSSALPSWWPSTAFSGKELLAYLFGLGDVS